MSSEPQTIIISLLEYKAKRGRQLLERCPQLSKLVIGNGHAALHALEAEAFEPDLDQVCPALMTLLSAPGQ